MPAIQEGQRLESRTSVHPQSRSAGPWTVAIRRLRANRAGMVALCVLALIVLACACAPLYATHVADVDPFQSNVSGTTVVDGRSVQVVAPNESGLGATPIGPTLERHYFLGADAQGRDVAARLLYGGRTSLVIALGSALLTVVFGTAVGLVAGLVGGATDALISRLLELIWAFPVILLAVSLSSVLATRGLELGPLTIQADSLLLPMIIIGLIFVPYLARPVRAEARSLRSREFIVAAIAQGASNRRLVTHELLPNVIPLVVTILPLMFAAAVLTESALSFLSIGVQAPDASWGTIIADGQGLLYSRPWVSIVPGLLIALTVLCFNVLGDAVLAAIDPHDSLRAKARPRRLRRRLSV